MGKNVIYQAKERSCLKFQIKKQFVVKHGQIIATISQVSKFHMFLYLITMSFKHLQNVFRAVGRERMIMVVGRQDSTRLDPCSLQDCSLQHEVLCEVGVSW